MNAGMFTYSVIFDIMSIAPGKRDASRLALLENWFRKKSKLFASCDRETLLDVIQHCVFVTRKKDDVILLQGEKGHRFFIILRGSVSVMLRDTADEVILGEEKLEPRHMNRDTLGSVVVTLGEGQTFGELALIHPDCFRNASVVADERCDLVVIHRDLYNRSVSKVIAREYTEKMNFIDSLPFLKGWTQRMKRQLGVSFRKETHAFDTVLVRQGDLVKELYFIVSGEVKLQVDPESHYTEFKRFMDKCRALLEDDSDTGKSARANFPKKLLPQLQKFSRMNKASMSFNGKHILQSGGQADVSYPTDWSPSAIRKMNQEMYSKRVSVNLAFLGERQLIGDVELLLNMMFQHATAVCSRETTVMVLHRNHFERLFRKKAVIANLRELSRSVETQLTMRCLKPNIHESVPLLRCMLYKVQELNGERRTGDEFRFMMSLRQLIADATTNSTSPHHQTTHRTSERDAMRSLRPTTVHHVHAERHVAEPLETARQRTMFVPKISG